MACRLLLRGADHRALSVLPKRDCKVSRPLTTLVYMDASLTLRRVGIRRRSDDDVLAHAFDGDPVAFAEVYRRYHKPIYGYCLARLMDPEAAADAAQEVFVRFLKAGHVPSSGV